MPALSNNAYYMTLSNQLIRKQDLTITTNNAANANTIGYEEDNQILSSIDYQETKRKDNSFVYSNKMYKSGQMGGIKYTGNPLDLAIIGSNQYFKLLTPNGIRYTLAGNILKNIDGVLVNHEGVPFLSFNNGLIQLPNENSQITVASDGTIFSNDDEIDRIGIAYFPNKNSLVKEGNNLYSSLEPETPIDNFTIQSGALRASNVNAAKAMGQTVEAQRSFSITNNLLNDISDIEKQAVSRILKPH